MSRPAVHPVEVPPLIDGRNEVAPPRRARMKDVQCMTASFGVPKDAGKTLEVGGKNIQVYGPSDRETTLPSIVERYPNLILVDFTVPNAVNGCGVLGSHGYYFQAISWSILRIYSKDSNHGTKLWEFSTVIALDIPVAVGTAAMTSRVADMDHGRPRREGRGNMGATAVTTTSCRLMLSMKVVATYCVVKFGVLLLLERGGQSTADVLCQIRKAQRAQGPATIFAVGTATQSNIVFIKQSTLITFEFRVTKSEHMVEVKEKFKRICRHS
ncbi:Dihydrodipicolinate reductase, bacterial/plant [Artemisia annua]|uniref:Dihydrodipicolinate reductase, bacterial/plant n=1 Tax=Artemisia annua TaxID=35608 RepID=A0A2U1L1V2_ARTAN|nr:Dihydrodipicolinate reductase, bacterial/plant [Artemisia annua]